ncbi:hypothetical protein AB3S75_045653 [Citrus x aurantiifolia]
MRSIQSFLFVILGLMAMLGTVASHNYADALTKSILFFEGQRSGKLPQDQRMTWRKDSALNDGADIGVDLTGGYYDAGDNVKFTFPMAFTATVLAWSVLEFGDSMGPDQHHALNAIRWATDFLMKATNKPDTVYFQVGHGQEDHNCWQRPEDMDTPRTVFAATIEKPSSDVSAEIAAALAATSIVFKYSDQAYSATLLSRAKKVFEFGHKHRGRYSENYAKPPGAVCPFYCSGGIAEDDLAWGAMWLFKATNYDHYYWNSAVNSSKILNHNLHEFGWEGKNAGINVLVSTIVNKDGGTNKSDTDPFIQNADKFVCALMPESPTKVVYYTPGGLLKLQGVNFKHASLTFLLVVYSRFLKEANKEIHCGHVVVKRNRLIEIAKGYVDYMLGNNPMDMSYMVGYGKKFPHKIHHRGASLPSMDKHPAKIPCANNHFFHHSDLNELTGAIVGGPFDNDSYVDDRNTVERSEPTTYMNAPFVGLLAYFNRPPPAYI